MFHIESHFFSLVALLLFTSIATVHAQVLGVDYVVSKDGTITYPCSTSTQVTPLRFFTKTCECTVILCSRSHMHRTEHVIDFVVIGPGVNSQVALGSQTTLLGNLGDPFHVSVQCGYGTSLCTYVASGDNPVSPLSFTYSNDTSRLIGILITFRNIADIDLSDRFETKPHEGYRSTSHRILSSSSRIHLRSASAS
jgi:hypothetical protein